MNSQVAWHLLPKITNFSFELQSPSHQLTNLTADLTTTFRHDCPISIAQNEIVFARHIKKSNQIHPHLYVPAIGVRPWQINFYMSASRTYTHTHQRNWSTSTSLDSTSAIHMRVHQTYIRTHTRARIYIRGHQYELARARAFESSSDSLFRRRAHTIDSSKSQSRARTNANNEPPENWFHCSSRVMLSFLTVACCVCVCVCVCGGRNGNHGRIQQRMKKRLWRVYARSLKYCWLEFWAGYSGPDTMEESVTLFWAEWLLWLGREGEHTSGGYCSRWN